VVRLPYVCSSVTYGLSWVPLAERVPRNRAFLSTPPLATPSRRRDANRCC